MTDRYSLRVLDETFQVVKLPASTELPDTKDWPQPYFIAHSEQELSILLVSGYELDDRFEGQVSIEPGWTGFVIDQSLDFGLIGVIARISSILATANISLMAISTFDTDYFFVKQENFEGAKSELSANGYRFL